MLESMIALITMMQVTINAEENSSSNRWRSMELKGIAVASWDDVQWGQLVCFYTLPVATLGQGRFHHTRTAREARSGPRRVGIGQRKTSQPLKDRRHRQDSLPTYPV